MEISNETFHPSQALVHKWWEDFCSGVNEPPLELRPEIRESWIRCRATGVKVSRNAAPIVLTGDQLLALQANAALCKAAAPLLRLIASTLEGTSALVTLTDHEARVLMILGDSKTRTIGERINFVLGSQWCESEMGTGPLGLVATLGKPLQINWSEHFLEIGHSWTTCAVPVLAPPINNVLGMIGVLGYREVAHPGVLKFVADAAKIIESRLRDADLQNQLFLYQAYYAHRRRNPNDPLLCLTTDGRIVVASNSARAIPGATDSPIRLDLQRGQEPSDIRLDAKPGHPIDLTLLPLRNGPDLVGFLGVVRAHGRLAPPKRSAKPAWLAPSTFANIIGQSVRMHQSIEDAAGVAAHQLPVLIYGESGTGKELFAQAIHNASDFARGSFVPLNCGGLSDELLSAELFGYEEGAFTGATRGGRPGKFELAENGTLFLDEVEEMSPRMQTHLLRALEEKSIVRVGGTRPQTIHVRVIAATNIDLLARVRDGSFRADLYYRLNVLALALPPLRERPGDIQLLVEHFRRSQLPPFELSADVIRWFEAYCWPGNIRELRNVLVQSAIKAKGDLVRLEHLPPSVCPVDCRSSRCRLLSACSERAKAQDLDAGNPDFGPSREALVQILTECAGNISTAAARLGLHRTTVYRRMRKLGVCK